MMNKRFVAAVMVLLFAAVPAIAQERAGDAALGALSGAVVLGPIGAVAGALVGYTAGPSIAHSWGLRGNRPSSRKQLAQSRPGHSKRDPPKQAAIDPDRVQQSAPAVGNLPEAASKRISATLANPSGTPAKDGVAPPIQTFE